MTREGDLEILFDARAVEQAVLEIAAQIPRDYAGKALPPACALKGAAILTRDLARRTAITATF